MEDILIISNYYPPEKGAAANRIEQLAKKLNENNYNVTVVCPLANYPKGVLFPEYKNRFSVNEIKDNIRIKRLWIFPSNSKNIAKRLFSTLSFSTCLIAFLLFKKTPKKVIVQSPPLLLSFLSVAILRIKRKKIILNVSDLWPLAAIELNALRKDSFSHKCSLYFERFIYKHANVIIGQSDEILTHIKTFLPEKNCFLYRNYPNHPASSKTLETNQNIPIQLFYAGLLGVAQGVLEMCEKIELDNINIQLHIFGDGAEGKQIKNLIANNLNSKIVFHGMLDRSTLHEKLKSFDIAIVPLKTRIYGSVPSKIFEYSAMGFPILYFGGGEGELLVKEYDLGWISAVSNYEELNSQLKVISTISKPELEIMKTNIFKTAHDKFDLDIQIKSLIAKGVF